MTRRRWLLAGVVALGLVIAAVVVALLNFNAFLERNRDWVAERISAALGRPVAFGSVRLSLRGGLGAQVEDLRIADDPAFARDDFLRVQRARVVVRILPALFGRYEVRRLVLEAPEVTVIRTARGFNVESIGGARPAQPGVAPPPGAAPPSEAAPGEVPAVLVSTIEIRDGVVRWVDRTVTPPRDLTVADVDLTASDVSPTTPVDVEVAAALLADRQNLEARGTLGPLDADPMPVDLTVTLDPLDVRRVREAVAAAAQAWPPALTIEGPIGARARVAGRVPRGGAGGRVPPVAVSARLEAEGAAVRWADAFAKPAGVPMRLEVDAAPVEGEDALAVRTLALRLADLAVDGEGRVTTATPPAVDVRVTAPATGVGGVAALLPALAASGLGGRVALDVRAVGPVGGGRVPTLDGTVTLDGVEARGEQVPVPVEGLSTTVRLAGHGVTVPATRFRVAGAPVEVAATVARYLPPVRFDARARAEGAPIATLLGTQWVTGAVDGELQLAGEGADAAAIRRSLRGNGRAAVRDGVLRGVNLAEAVLRGVTGVPGLSAFLQPLAAEDYPEIFGTSDTPFQAASGTFVIADQRVRSDDLALAARDYAIRGKGAVGFDGMIDATATLVASERLTRDVVAEVQPARFLTDDTGRLAIPFALRGRWPAVRPLPDRSVLTTALQGAARGRLGELLGGKESGGAGRAPAKPSPTEDAIRRGLGGILGGGKAKEPAR
jgi:hypothetical protein